MPSDLYVGTGKFGGILATLGTNDLRVRTGGTDPTDDTQTRVTINSGGEVGIGTTDPDPHRLVTLEGKSSAYLIARTTTGPHEVLLGANSDGAVLAANTPGDDLVLGANGDSPVMWVKSSGRIGVNTPSPDRDITVEGAGTAYISARTTQGNREVLVGADSTGTMLSAMSNDDLQLRAGGNVNRVTIKASGDVGVGTDGPTAKLDVRGSIRLGLSGQYYAPGGINDWAIIAGNVDSNGAILIGAGFTVNYNPFGPNYTITFNAAFASPPVVTVTPFNSTWLVPLVLSATGGGFVVELWNGLGAASPFGFTALGVR